MGYQRTLLSGLKGLFMDDSHHDGLAVAGESVRCVDKNKMLHLRVLGSVDSRHVSRLRRSVGNVRTKMYSTWAHQPKQLLPITIGCVFAMFLGSFPFPGTPSRSRISGMPSCTTPPSATLRSSQVTKQYVLPWRSSFSVVMGSIILAASS